MAMFLTFQALVNGSLGLLFKPFVYLFILAEAMDLMIVAIEFLGRSDQIC
jgi:hypothetical protein